jgi:hypothetical protein
VVGDEKRPSGGKTRRRPTLACCCGLQRKKRGKWQQPERTAVGRRLIGVDKAMAASDNAIGMASL